MPHEHGPQGHDDHGHDHPHHDRDHGHDHDHHDHDHRDHHGHDHGHAHGHAHSHGHHHHGPARHDTAFAIGVTLNGGLVAAQAAVGLAAGSMALLADAVHNLGDVLGLVLAWAALVLGRRAPTAARTYGWGRFSILAALANAMILLVSIGAIGLEAVQRLLAPSPIQAGMVAWVAGIGLVVNGATAALFMRGHDDLNIRSAFAHMASDAVLSAGVLVAALVVGRTGIMWIDPAASLVIVGVIGAGTWGLLRDSVTLAMDAVPPGVDQAAISTWLRALPGVAEVHDLHVWALSTTQNAVTVHLVQTEAGPAEALTKAACAGLRERFKIGHATIQVETPHLAALCLLRPAEVV